MRIEVADAGPGIPPEIRRVLFRPFKTTKARGTGLGMATAKRLVELHDGRIVVECPEGGGTVVRVELPAGGLKAAGRSAGLLEPELLDAIADLIAVHSQQRRCLGLVPPAALERLHHQRTLQLLQVDPARRQPDLGGQLGPSPAPSIGNCSSSSWVPSLSSIARSTALRSSRTLPGQR